MQTDLGEALATFPEHHAAARRMLTSLEQRDLLTTAEGYGALAALRGRAADKPGWQGAAMEALYGPSTTIDEARRVTLTRKVMRPMDAKEVERRRRLEPRPRQDRHRRPRRAF